MKREMITVIFVKDCYLPRFKMNKGDRWTIRKERLTPTGFALAGGYVTSEYFKK